MVYRKILGLVGYPTVGKDLASEALVADGWVRVSLADPIREGLLGINPYVPDEYDTVRLADLVRRDGWEKAKRNEEVRRLLQTYGTEGGRKVHGDDCWRKIAGWKILKAHPKNVVVTDVRFFDERPMILEWAGKLIYIEKPGVEPVNGHASEKDYALLRRCASLEIRNDGTKEDLHRKIREAVDEIFD